MSGKILRRRDIRDGNLYVSDNHLQAEATFSNLLKTVPAPSAICVHCHSKGLKLSHAVALLGDARLY